MATTLPIPVDAKGRDSKPSKGREELLAIFRAAREEVHAANPSGRDLLEELFAERRLEAENE